MSLCHLGGITLLSLSCLMGALPAAADPPGLYYAWRTLAVERTTCLSRARAALTAQELQTIQVEGNSVAGSTEEATAAIVCLDQPGSITIMIMVSSLDDALAFELREALKASF